MSNNHIFFDIMERIGSAGNYQNLLLLLWSISFLTNGASTYFNAFLFFQQEYVCPSGMKNCNEYICSLSAPERIHYVNPESQTFLSNFGDYRCDSSGLIEGLQSFIYIGGLFGVLVGSFLNQYISKKRLLVVTVILNIFGILITIFSSSLFISSLGLFLNYAGKFIQSELIPCIITQKVSKQKRGKHVMIGYFFYGLGVTLNGAVFMLIKDWRIVLIVYQLLPFVIMLGGFLFFIEETPFDSITFSNAQSSFEAFKRIASINGINDHGLTLQYVEQVKRQYQQNEQSKHNQVISIIDLFRYDSLRMITIISIFLQFLISYQFNVPQLIIKDYALNIYLSGIILGFSELLSSIICYFLINQYQRKKIIYIVQALGIVVSAPIFFFASCSESVSQCGLFLSVIQIVGIFLFRMFVTIGYNIFYMAQYEMFPTQIRSLGIQFTSSVAILAVVVSPPLQIYFKTKGISMIITFTISCLLIMLGTIKMPQTYNIPPPQIIQELRFDDQGIMKDSVRQNMPTLKPRNN